MRSPCPPPRACVYPCIPQVSTVHTPHVLVKCHYVSSFPHVGSSTQGVYNRLLLVPIVGGACFHHHQLAAVFNASFGVFQMTYEMSRINRMGEEGDFCEAMLTYP